MMDPTIESRPTVLVVDDDPTMRLLLRETLELADFAVQEAATGERALELVGSVLPNLVLLDVGLPGIDGFEVCIRMREAADPARLPIIMVTGMDDLESIDRAYQAGATDFIAKPINWPMLGHRARYVLRAARALRDLRAAEERNSAMLRAIPDMMFTLDANGRCLDFRPGIGGMQRYPGAARLIGQNVATWLPADVAASVLDAVRKAAATGEIQSAFHRLCIEGRDHYCEVRMALAGPDEILALVRDVTAQRQNEEKIRTLAYCDSLTGLPNRQAFLERLEEELARIGADGGRLAVIFLDLDGFKRINDTLGHNAGDYLLQSLAQRLNAELRATDLVSRPVAVPERAGFARLGGDEFTIMLPRVDDLRVVASVADRVRELVARPFVLAGQEIVVTASLGIALFPDDGNDANTLLKHADTAMYHAKDAGRNNWQVYSAALTTRARLRLELENDLRRALARSEFFLHYQPQVGADGSISSVEALLRWRHPQRGIVPPQEFVPIAEETGFIIPLGRWVLAEACAAARRWRDAGLGGIRTAVNLSGRHLRDPSFVDDVLQALAGADLPGRLLELELTESILMDSSDATVAQMRSLRSAGIAFSIDDFGTGYSSMSYLKRFPIRTLKVDRSFVRGLPGDADDVAIAGAIISMAHSLRLEVIAEGVETPAQAEFLRAAGCDKLQGYLFGRPMPAEAIAALLAEAKRPPAASNDDGYNLPGAAPVW